MSAETAEAQRPVEAHDRQVRAMVRAMYGPLDEGGAKGGPEWAEADRIVNELYALGCEVTADA